MDEDEAELSADKNEINSKAVVLYEGMSIICHLFSKYLK